ncbi:MAG: hypothetical protein K6E83_00885 [Clostridium sp.]|nr:hypothetical protein [Clostridium sp.]
MSKTVMDRISYLIVGSGYRAEFYGRIAQQYPRYPGLVMGFSAVRDGRIGTPRSAYLSLVHDYHAASLLRRMLLTGDEDYVIRGSRTQTPAAVTDSRQGAVYDDRTAMETRDTAVIDDASGKRAVYDFSGVQYHSFLRSRHLVVRGDRGEWNDNLLYELEVEGSGGADDGPDVGPDSAGGVSRGTDLVLPRTECLLPVIREKYRVLDTAELRDLRKIWRPELHLDTAQDEFAIATMLLDMGERAAGVSEEMPYPLREALQDAYFRILLERAMQDPWKEIRPERMPWDEALRRSSL